MYEETINEKTRAVLAKISKLERVKSFYLAGGTALALELGHRESIDLDFFHESDFDVFELKEDLSRCGELAINFEKADTLDGTLDDVKVSFLKYPYSLLFSLHSFENTSIADERDIAAMKLSAISSRGSKKDFIDLAFLLEKYSLGELLGFFHQKFENFDYNTAHLLKSLIYFDDAEDEPDPKMLIGVSWEAVKEKITTEVNNFLIH